MSWSYIYRKGGHVPRDQEPPKTPLQYYSLFYYIPRVNLYIVLKRARLKCYPLSQILYRR
jgi:hypothetical protein